MKEVDVIITKNPMTKIAKTVYAHELPALAFAHKHENIEVTAEREVAVPGFNPANEYERLKRVYDRKNMDVVGAVYGLSTEKLEQLTGVKASNASTANQVINKVRELPPVRQAP